MMAASARVDHAVIVWTADAVVGFGGLAPNPIRNVRGVAPLVGGSVVCMDCLQLSNATVDTSSPMERCRAVHAVIAFSLDEFAIDVRNMTDRRRMRFRFARLTMTLLTLWSGVNACATASRGTSAVVEGT